MGNQEDNFFRLESAKGLVQMMPCVGVEPGGRFVEEEDWSIGSEGACEGNALPLSHAEFGAAVEQAAEEGLLFLRQAVYNRLGTSETKGVTKWLSG
jgi:hypothetical protein